MARIIDKDRYLIIDLIRSEGQRSLVIALTLIFLFLSLSFWGRAPRGMGFLVWVLLSILLATLVVMIFFSRKLFFKIVFDRNERVIEFIMGVWLWQKKMKIPFDEVKALKIGEQRQRGASSWKLKLETGDGETWPLYHSLQETEIRRFGGQAAQTLGCSLLDESTSQPTAYSPREVNLSLRERYRQGMLNLSPPMTSSDCPIKLEEKGGATMLSPRRRGPKVFMGVAFGIFIGMVVLQFALLYARVLSRTSERDPAMMKIIIMYVVVTILLFGFVTLFLWRRFGAQKVEVSAGKLTFYHGPRYGFIPLEEIKNIAATTGGGYPKVEIVGRDKILTLTGWGDRTQNEWLAEKLKELVIKTG